MKCINFQQSFAVTKKQKKIYQMHKVTVYSLCVIFLKLLPMLYEEKKTNYSKMNEKLKSEQGMSSRKETNKLKSNRHRKDYRTDNTVKRNKIARKLYASYSFNLANYTLHTMEHKQNISLIMYRNVNSFFLYCRCVKCICNV